MAYNQVLKHDLVFDIETLALPVSQSDIDKAMNEYKPPKTYKLPEAIAKHKAKFRLEIADKLSKEKAFSLGGKRMISAAFGRIDYETEKVVDIQSWASEDLSVVTKGIAQYVDSFKNFRLIGFNSRQFDLPEILKSFRLTGVRPNYRASKWDHVDLMDTFKKGGLKETCRIFGIETIGNSGDQVAEMYEQGRFEDIQAYNEDDVRITGELMLAASSLVAFY